MTDILDSISCTFCRTPATWKLPSSPNADPDAPALYACAMCKSLIEARAVEGLYERAVSAMRVVGIADLALLRDVHDRFWKKYDAAKVISDPPPEFFEATARLTCSFCRAPSKYRLESESDHLLPSERRTDLVVCERCKDLVLLGDEDALLAFANSALRPGADIKTIEAVGRMRHAQQHFWAAFDRLQENGEALRFTSTEDSSASVSIPLLANRKRGLTLSSGFTRCDFCNDSKVVEILDVPNFHMAGQLNSTDGWAVCGPCRTFVNAPDAPGLLRRSIDAARRDYTTHNLSMSEQEKLIQQLHLRFWRAKEEDTQARIKVLGKRIEDIKAQQETYERLLANPKALPPNFSPWIDAIEEQYEAIRTLEFCIRRSSASARIKETWQHDLEAARIAEAYSFSGDALLAIQSAAASVPLDCILAPEQIPGTGHGWWHFAPPLPIKTTYDSNDIRAILWSYVRPTERRYGRGTEIDRIFHDLTVESTGFLSFSLYSRLASGELSPTTEWRWLPHETISDALARTTIEYNANYKGGTPPEATNGLLGLEHTLDIIRQVSCFFLAAASWLENDIIDKVPGHIERHHSKRLQKENKLKERPQSVHVIALRKRHIVHEDADGQPIDEALIPIDAPSKREFRCNWVVDRHWRKQAYGPGRTQRKLIVIEAYPKGPTDKPFKPKPKRVFAVIR